MLPGDPALLRSLPCPVARAVWRLQAEFAMRLSSRFRVDRRSPFFIPLVELGKSPTSGEVSRDNVGAVRASHIDCLRTIAGLSVYVRVWDKVPLVSVCDDRARAHRRLCGFSVYLSVPALNA